MPPTSPPSESLPTAHDTSSEIPVPPTSASPPLVSAWNLTAPVVLLCLDPCPSASAALASTPLATLYSSLYSVCAAPPPTAAAQPHILYALLRSLLHTHARAAANVLSDLAGVPRSSPPVPDLHLLSNAAVASRTEYLLSVTGRLVPARDVLATYVRLWRAFADGIAHIACIFMYLNRVWIGGRVDFGSDGMQEEERAALGRNSLAVYDVRLTALLAWRCQVVEPLGELVSRAVLSAISADRARRSCRADVSNVAQARVGMKLRELRPVLESFCVVGNEKLAGGISGKGEEEEREMLRDFGVEGNAFQRDGLDSSSPPGHSPLGCFPNPLRVPESEREGREYALYRSLFEGPFLTASHRFYEDESACMLLLSESGDLDGAGEVQKAVRMYVRKVGGILKQELELVSEEKCGYADASTAEPLKNVLVRALIADHVELLHAAAEAMFLEHAKDDLRLLYSVLERVPGALRPVHALLRTRVETFGRAAVKPWASYDSLAQPPCFPIRAAWLPKGCHSEIGEEEERPSFSDELPRTPSGGFVQAAWEVFSSFSELTSFAFGTDRDLLNAMEQGCERFVNSVEGAPELLAQCQHELLEAPLKSGHRAASPEGAKTWIERVVRMFRFLNDKDVFQRVYAVKLTHRLVYRSSLWRDVEIFSLEMLRGTCGRDFTSRLSRMFADVASSAEETACFVAGQEEPALAVDVLVLSSTVWPFLSSPGRPISLFDPDGGDAEVAGSHAGPASISSDDDSSSSSSTSARRGICHLNPDERSLSSLAVKALAALPSRISKVSAAFVESYSSRHESRVLQYLYHFCRVEIDALVDSGHSDETIALEASLPQAAVLLQFNDHENLSVQSLCVILGQTEKETAHTLASLLKSGVLVCEGCNDKAAPGDTDSSTASFSSASILRVSPAIGRLPTNHHGRALLVDFESEDKAQVHPTDRRLIDTDRRQTIKACVVRILKERKRVDGSEIVALTQRKLAHWFPLGTADVEASLANLVENEYVEELDGVYLYVP